LTQTRNTNPAFIFKIKFVQRLLRIDNNTKFHENLSHREI